MSPSKTSNAKNEIHPVELVAKGVPLNCPPTLQAIANAISCSSQPYGKALLLKLTNVTKHGEAKLVPN